MLNELIKTANRAYTENGAVSPATTCSDTLDLFAAVGALRRESEHEITQRFLRAFAENRDLALKLAFFARDVRGGLGERYVFRTILRWLAEGEPDSVRKNIGFVPEYGRWDDLLVLIGTPVQKDVLAFIGETLRADVTALNGGENVSLLAKWLPSVNASCARTVKAAKIVARSLGMTDAEYRKTLTKLRARIKLIENNLRTRDYTFSYEQQPSKAMFKYRKAFLRNDETRYTEFLGRVRTGDAKMHTGTLTPYDIIAPLVSWRKPKVSRAERLSIDTTWNAQEDFTRAEDALVVIDGSGSMYAGAEPLPAAVALSLGIYFAERNKGAFRNHFITFSENPQLVKIKGRDIAEKVRYCETFNEIANTNIQKVFELILETAVVNKLPQKDMPATLYMISDMEFDWCVEDADLTNFECAKALFEANGYALPQVVFWNVASRNRQQPVTKNEQGVALVSGATPRIFQMLTSGTLSPYAFMMEVLGSERYEKIAA
jgi:hypothetical protein